MYDTQDVIEICNVANHQGCVSAFSGGPADEFRQRLTPDRGRPLESTLELWIQPKTFHPRSVSRSTLTVIQPFTPPTTLEWPSTPPLLALVWRLVDTLAG
ncbi:MAG: hypothetical protein M3493_09835 [Actinomycetota bacterium]|jgi:hypothetical protein|nr:hypothetical protein [Actinomycetota bacterium]